MVYMIQFFGSFVNSKSHVYSIYDIKVQGLADNVETENSDEEFKELPDIKVEDVAENFETENCWEKLKAFQKGHWD